MSVESVSNIIPCPSEQLIQSKSLLKVICVDLAILVTSVGLAALAGYAIALLTAGPIGIAIAVAVTIGVLVGVVGCIAYHLLNNKGSNSVIDDDLLKIDSEEEVEKLSESNEIADNLNIFENVTYSISKNETVESLKAMISAREGISVDDINRFMYAGKPLIDGRSLADYNIHEESVNVRAQRIGCRGIWYFLEKNVNKSESNIDQRQIDLNKKKSDENDHDVEVEKSEDSSSTEQEPIDSSSESFEGLISRDDKTVEDSSSTDQEPIDSSSHESVENVLGAHIEVNSESLQFEISIRCVGGDSENFEVSANDTIESLKGLIASRIGCSANDVKLIFAGESLEGEGSLAEHNIQTGSKIYRMPL